MKYSSWNEKEINALTLDCKWTTNPWAGLLFILQLCKPPSVFFFSSPTQRCQCVYTNLFLPEKIYNLFQLSNTSINKSSSPFHRRFFFFEQHKHLVSNTFSADDPLSEYSSPLIDWLHIDLCKAVLQIHFRNSSSAVCLDVDYVLNLIILKMLAKCHSLQTILLACNVFWTLESAYLHTVTELQLWSQKSLSLFHIYFVSLIT